MAQTLTWAPVYSSSNTALGGLNSPPKPFNIQARKLGPLQESLYFYPSPKPESLRTSSSPNLPDKVLLEAAPVTTSCNQN